jgi:ankyrin repeat protein
VLMTSRLSPSPQRQRQRQPSAPSITPSLPSRPSSFADPRPPLRTGTSNSHKRSKSTVARSLLNRVSSRGDVPPHSPVADDTMAENSNSPTSLHPNASRTSNVGSRPLVSNTMSNRLSMDMSNVHTNRDPDASSVTPSSATQGASIEQSVRLFKVFEALRNGDTAAISRAAKGDDNMRLEGTSILHLAIQCAELAVIEFVLSQQAADVNARDRDGNTPLHIAAQLGRVPVVKLLLDQKDVNDTVANYQGKTPMDLARSPDIYQQLQLSRSMFIDTNVRKVHQLVTRSDYDGLQALLADNKVRATLDVNGPELATDPSTKEHGGTLLHEAARKKDTKLAQILLLSGADPFRRDKKGKLPQDVTKDDHTKAILKKSPAAAAAQRSIQERTILGDNMQAPSDSGPTSKESREMKGYLRKWTNYTSGYKLRWFVLEDGVLSYYKNQDDAGSACRGAINMRIAKLKMDPKDKLLFEILGKSSVRYNLKANHEVEQKRWFWALNNAIQWAKDEEREDAKRQEQETAALREARKEQIERQHTREENPPHLTGNSLLPSSATAAHAGPSSARAASSVQGTSNYEPSFVDDPMFKHITRTNTATMDGDLDDDDDYGDDASSHDVRPANRDAFSITAQSAKLQLDLLEQVSAALKRQQNTRPDTQISHPEIAQALSSYETAVGNLKGLVMDLLRISKDHEAFWQYRLEREQNVRRLWEDSMARVAQEQEELETRIGESEDKRKRTKRALRDALESKTSRTPSITEDREAEEVEASVDTSRPTLELPKESMTIRRRPTIAALTNNEVSDDEDDDEEEFFDAMDAGEFEVLDAMPPSSPPAKETKVSTFGQVMDEKSAEQDPPSYAGGDKLAQKKEELARDIEKSYKGYEDGVRKRLKLDADNRPKVGLWVSEVLELPRGGTTIEFLMLTPFAGHSQVHDRKGHDQDDPSCVLQRAYLPPLPRRRRHGVH